MNDGWPEKKYLILDAANKYDVQELLEHIAWQLTKADLENILNTIKEVANE